MSEIILEGTATPDQTQTYWHIPFEVPAGVSRLDVRYEYDNVIGSDPHLTDGNTVDIGIFDPRGIGFLGKGFRGWSGSARQSFFIGLEEATPGYMPGPIQAGTWHICLGLYKVAASNCHYKVTIGLTHGETAHVGEFPALLPLSSQPRPDKRQPSGWYKGEMHCHTYNSDGDSDPLDVIRKAEALGLDFLAITDHNVLTQQIKMRTADTDLILIPGMEVTTYKGHWNIWGDYDWIDFRVEQESDMQRSVAEAQRRGYTVSCNHPKPYGPEWVYEAVADFHSIEVWNGPWEMFNTHALEFWEAHLRRGKRYTAVGGSDAHFHQREHIAQLAQPTLWVYCEGDPSAVKLLDAIRAGHVFISEAPDGPQLYLQAGTHIMGDIIPARVDQLQVSVRAVHAIGAIIELCGSEGVLYSNTVETVDWETTFTVTTQQTRYVRAQLIDHTNSHHHIRALTNPLYL